MPGNLVIPVCTGARKSSGPNGPGTPGGRKPSQLVWRLRKPSRPPDHKHITDPAQKTTLNTRQPASIAHTSPSGSPAVMASNHEARGKPSYRVSPTATAAPDGPSSNNGPEEDDQLAPSHDGRAPSQMRQEASGSVSTPARTRTLETSHSRFRRECPFVVWSLVRTELHAAFQFGL